MLHCAGPLAYFLRFLDPLSLLFLPLLSTFVSKRPSVRFKFTNLRLFPRRRSPPNPAFSAHCPSPASPSSSPFMESPPEGYRRHVGVCLIRSSKEIFAASRLDIPDAWQMPQVRVKIQELQPSSEIIAEGPYWLTYDFPPEVREKLKRQWGSDWKGQAEKWFLLRFNGKEEEIDLLGDGSEKPEFGQ